MKPFTSIPGPKALPLIGTLYRYYPIIGDLDHIRLHKTGLQLYKQYGPLVREMRGSIRILNVFKPKDIEAVFFNDGQFPARKSHSSVEQYRIGRPDKYSSGGLLSANGKEWWRLRQKSQALSKLPCIRRQIPLINQVYDDFIGYFDTLIDPTTKQVDDCIKYLQVVFLEASASIAIDDRIKYFGSNVNSEEAERLRVSANTTTMCVRNLEMGLPYYKYFKTPTYKKLIEAQDEIYRITAGYVEAKRRKLELGPTTDPTVPPTPLEHFLLDDKLSNQDIMTIIGDVIIAGIETTAYSMVFILYHIARNLDKQEKLFEEVQDLLPDPTMEVTNEILNNAKYTKAVIKESLRLNPASYGVGRLAAQNFELSGYEVPKGTMIITQHHVASQLDENFTYAAKFLPERWQSKELENRVPYATLPFGVGPRACLGRRLAEMTMGILLMKMVRKYKMTYASDKKLDVIFKMVNEPDGPLLLQLHRRSDVTNS